MTDLDSISVIIAALAHDIQHGAVTNRFLVNSRDRLAIKYNDISVLENMHASQTFRILSDESSNIFSGISPSDFFAARKLIIDLILGTDMTKHFNFLGNFRARLNIADLNLQKEEDKSTVLIIALKCADLGHSAKTLDLHRKWSELVCEEFFNQGDLEKSKYLPVSMYCDRDSTNVPKSQAGFIKNVCLPLFEVLTTYLSSEIVTGHCIINLKRNLEYWEKRSILRPNTVLYEPAIIAPPILKRKTQDVTRNKSLSTY
jgi:3',5'-cyclic-nucleotide phosphodiesterase/cAMP-specific phosphodiesterase 4